MLELFGVAPLIVGAAIVWAWLRASCVCVRCGRNITLGDSSMLCSRCERDVLGIH